MICKDCLNHDNCEKQHKLMFTISPYDDCELVYQHGVEKSCLHFKNKAVELLPCPFCGGEAKVIYDDAGKWFYIACVNDECPIVAQGMWHTDMQKAIEEWNTRTPQ